MDQLNINTFYVLDSNSTVCGHILEFLTDNEKDNDEENLSLTFFNWESPQILNIYYILNRKIHYFVCFI